MKIKELRKLIKEELKHLNEGVLDNIEEIMYVSHPFLRTRDRFKKAILKNSIKKYTISDLGELSQLLGTEPSQIDTYTKFNNFMEEKYPNITQYEFEYDIS